MRFESRTNTSSTLFSEQVNKVVDLFHEWNDCERSVALYAILKRIPFSCTKFLQSVIDANLTQLYCLEHTKFLDKNSNSTTFIQNLIDTYKNAKCCGSQTQLNKDSIFFESDRTNSTGGGLQQTTSTTTSGLGSGLITSVGLCTSGSVNDLPDKYYQNKEDILIDILTLLPILTPGNDEAKSAYLELFPMTVEDAIRGTVNTALVQQIFSYLLIHPAFTTNDRRSLSKFLRHLEDHIVSTDPNLIQYPQGTSPSTSETAISTTTPSAVNWQAIAPPHSKSTETIISWDGSQHHMTASGGNIVCGTTSSIVGGGSNVHNGGIASSPAITSGSNGMLNSNGSTVGNASASNGGVPFNVDNSLVGNRIDFKSTPGSSPKLGLLYESGTEDHHISFSKNGTEILDFDCDDTDTSNTQIGFDTLANLNEFLTVPGIIDNITLKTRRSNSLTTTGSLQTTSTCTSSSAQNLYNIVQKPRSFSLSMVSPRSSLTSSGSDTRLDDFKPAYAKFTPHNIGMSNIGQWLKSLRLHKYVWLFSNITYDQMLDISEEYLQNLNVTKGARHKLVVCIQKLKERYAILCQLEKDLMANKTTLVSALEELTNVVLTPMKPVEHCNKQDVGGQFLKVLNLVSTMMTTKHIVPQDEEPTNSLLWVLEKAVHNEAFVAHTNQLKEHRFKASRIKLQFPPKTHYGGGNNNTSNTVTNNKAAVSTACGNLTRSSKISKFGLFDAAINVDIKKDIRRLSIDSGYSGGLSCKSSSTESFELIQSPICIPLTSSGSNDFSKNNFERTIDEGPNCVHMSEKYPEQCQKSPTEAILPNLWINCESNTPSFLTKNAIEIPYEERENIQQLPNIRSMLPPKVNDYRGTNKPVDTPDTMIKNADLNIFAFQTSICSEKSLKSSNLVETASLINSCESSKFFNEQQQRMSDEAGSSSLLPSIKQQLKIAPEFVPASKRNIAVNTVTREFPTLASQNQNVKKNSSYLITADKKPTFASVTSGHLILKSDVSNNSTEAVDFVRAKFSSRFTNVFGPETSLYESVPQVNMSHKYSEKKTTSTGFSKVISTRSMHETTPLWTRPRVATYQTTNSVIYRGHKTILSLNSQQHHHNHHKQNHHKQQQPTPPTHNATVLKLGMSIVPIWLKSLRLHKYQWVFNEMSYETMLLLSEEYLESLNITKGARNKLIISIKKLCDRYSIMDALEKDLITIISRANFDESKAKLMQALDELVYVVQTPMKPVQIYNPTDVANKFLILLNLVYEKIMLPTRSYIVRSEDEYIHKLVFILDKALNNEGLATYVAYLRKMRLKIPDNKKFLRSI